MKDVGEYKGKVVGNIFTTQILIPIPMKPIQIASKTTTILKVEVDISKLQVKNKVNINEGGSRSSIIKLVATLELKGEGKDVHVEPNEEEKK